MALILLGVALTIAAIVLHNRYLGFAAQTPADYAALPRILRRVGKAMSEP